MLTKRCCSTNTQFPSRMKSCESNLHTLASYFGSPKILDYAFTRDISDVREARVHDNIQSTDHAPISIKVNGLRVVSWNLEGLCTHSKREPMVIQNLSEIQQEFNEPILFLFQELFLQRDLKNASRINAMAKARMKRLLPKGYTFLSDDYTGGIAIPNSVTYEPPSFIDRPDKSGKKCMVVAVKYKGIRTNIANIHLKSIVLYPITGKQLQRKEMQNILMNTTGPTLFMGDFNTQTPKKLMTRKKRTTQ